MSTYLLGAAVGAVGTCLFALEAKTQYGIWRAGFENEQPANGPAYWNMMPGHPQCRIVDGTLTAVLDANGRPRLWTEAAVNSIPLDTQIQMIHLMTDYARDRQANAQNLGLYNHIAVQVYTPAVREEAKNKFLLQTILAVASLALVAYSIKKL